jgi:hypothetical protein
MKRFLILAIIAVTLVACNKDDDSAPSVEVETVGLYVLNEGIWGQGNANISYYDMATGQVTKTFSEVNGKSIGDGVNDLAIYGSKLYCVVSGGTEGYIEVINPTTGISQKRIPVRKNEVNGNPRSIIFHEGKAYITTYLQGVIRLDTATLEIDGEASLSGTYSEGLCLYNNNLYICNSGWGSGNTISVVNISSFSETGTITVPQNPVAIEVAPSGDIYFTTSTVYDANWVATAPTNLHILDPQRKEVSRTFDIRASKITLDKDFIYVIDYDYVADHINKINLQNKTVENISNIYEDYTMVYSVSTNPLTEDIYLGNQGNDVVAFDKDGKEKFSFKTTIPYILKVVPLIK